MKTTLALAAAIIISIGGAAGCSKNTVAGNTNGAAANTANTSNTAVTNTATQTASPAAYGSLATPTEAYKTAYAARKKGDIEMLKKVFSKDVLEFFEMMGKDEKKTLDDQLRELVKEPQASSDEVRNEKITGDTATIEYKKDETSWKTMDFIKEGNDWKMTIPKGDAKDKGPKQPE